LFLIEEVGFCSDAARTALVSRKVVAGAKYFDLPLPQSAIDTNPSLLGKFPYNFN
jgi:hypothetical protein